MMKCNGCGEHCPGCNRPAPAPAPAPKVTYAEA